MVSILNFSARRRSENNRKNRLGDRKLKMEEDIIRRINEEMEIE